MAKEPVSRRELDDAKAYLTGSYFTRLNSTARIAGLLVGPHVAFPLFADPETIETLSELGVILLMFALGLEFRLRKLVDLAPTAGLTALIQCSFMLWLGFVLGRAFGWTPLESIFTGALISISSTTIIAKAFDEQRVSGKLREFVVGVLIVEDLIAVLLMAGLTAASTGTGLSASEVFVGGRADGWQDDFLKRADENPNRKGLELVAQALGLALRPVADLAQAVAAGKVKGVWAVGAETPDEVVAAKLGGAEVVARVVHEPGHRGVRELVGADVVALA